MMNLGELDCTSTIFFDKNFKCDSSASLLFQLCTVLHFSPDLVAVGKASRERELILNKSNLDHFLQYQSLTIN